MKEIKPPQRMNREMLEASLPKGGTPTKGRGASIPQNGIQATPTHFVVDWYYVLITTPDGFTLKLNYDKETAHEVVKHFNRTTVKARVVSEKVKVRR